jgi:hypothetical protein
MPALMSDQGVAIRHVLESGIHVSGRGVRVGAGCRDRTRDPLITNQVLYQLS